MICKVIGIGAAGNKAAICAVTNNVISDTDTMLVNSTMKDIPADYKGKANCHQFANSYGGCGKERDKSNQLCEASLKSDIFGLEAFLGVGTERKAELVIIVASTEGGTGSGATPLFARFIRNVYGIAVHVYALAGFEEDARGMRNTVEFFKELEGNYTIQCTKNSKFIRECNNNRIKAEKAANQEFCRKISILMGLQLRDTIHNIDPTDLLKLSRTPGYMIIESAIIDNKIKNAEQFRNMLVDMIDNSKAFDIDNPSQKRLGVIINISESSTDYIDYDDILVERFGMPFEKYEHIQYEPAEEMPQFVAFISAGMEMPIEEIASVYGNYEEASSQVKTDTDPFFSTVRNTFDIKSNDAQFDLEAQQANLVSKDDFFSNKTFTNTKPKVKVVPNDMNEY